MMTFDSFTPWQWELAIVASRFELGLLSDAEIIAFTHKLMDKGFYDDLMIGLIEADPFIYQFNLFTDFKTLRNSLNLPYLDSEASEYLNIFNLACHIIPQPFNFQNLLRLSKNRKLYCTFESEYLHKNRPLPYLVTEDLKKIFSLIDDLDDYFTFYLSNEISTEEIIGVYLKLCGTCESWLNQNIDLIFEIMYQLFPQH